MIRVLVADDHAVVREGLKRILDRAADIAVVAESATSEDTLAGARATRPDIVLLDLSMPGKDGLSTARDLQQELPNVRVLVLTVHPEDHLAVLCLKAGVGGYMTKDAAPEDLVQAIRRLARGGRYISPELAERLALSLEDGYQADRHVRLSDRELQVMRLMGATRTIGEIAQELHLSVKTVSTYRTRILEKMGLKNNAEIIRYALEQGLTE